MARTDVEIANLTVLVVDDQDFVRTIIVQLLRRIGVRRVLEKGDGSAALELLEYRKPDLILCDIKMTPVDGLQFLRDVRGGLGGQNPHVPVIFLTSASDHDTVQAAIDNDVDGYLVKPVSAEDLRKKIVSVMTRRNSAKGVSWAAN